MFIFNHQKVFAVLVSWLITRCLSMHTLTLFAKQLIITLLRSRCTSLLEQGNHRPRLNHSDHNGRRSTRLLQRHSSRMSKSNIQKLQRSQNSIARIVNGTRWSEHITLVLARLHWLKIAGRIEYKVAQRIIFKIAVLAFHCVRGTCPVYFKDVCVPLAAIPGRTNLRAADPGAIYKNEDWWPKFLRCSTHCLEFTTTSFSQCNY